MLTKSQHGVAPVNADGRSSWYFPRTLDSCVRRNDKKKLYVLVKLLGTFLHHKQSRYITYEPTECAVSVDTPKGLCFFSRMFV